MSTGKYKLLLQKDLKVLEYDTWEEALANARIPEESKILPHNFDEVAITLPNGVIMWSSKDDKLLRERYLGYSPEQWIRQECGDIPKKNTPSIYFDIDGVLGKWYADARGYSSLEEIIDPVNHYFRDIEPHPFMIDLAHALQDNGEDVCIISSSDWGTTRDKWAWIDANLPFLPKENIFFCPLGANKTEFVKGNADKSILIDDYNVNLDEWTGKSIKAINTVNSHQLKYPEIDMREVELFPDSDIYYKYLEETVDFLHTQCSKIKEKSLENIDR